MWFKLVQDKETPLHMAARYGNSESVQLLLTAKSNIHAEDRVSDSLLQIRWNCVVLSCVVWIGAGLVHSATACPITRTLRLCQAFATSIWLHNSITRPLQRALYEFLSVNRRQQHRNRDLHNHINAKWHYPLLKIAAGLLDNFEF